LRGRAVTSSNGNQMKRIEQASKWPIIISQEVKGVWKNQNLPWISVGPDLSY